MTKPPGIGLFRAGAITLLVFASIHLIPVFRANFLPPRDAREAALKTTLVEYTESLGPLTASAWGAMQILNSGYSILLFFVATLDLALIGVAAQSGKLGRIAAINAAFCAALCLAPLWFQFPPPIVFAAPAALLFSLSWRAASAAPAGQ